MPITTSWLNSEQTIIQISYAGSWTWPEFELAITQANLLMDEVHHPVNMVILMPDGLPREISPARFRVVFNKFHRNIRTTALIGASKAVSMTINAFMRVLGQRDREFFFADSVDDAYIEFSKRHGNTREN